MRLKRLWLGFTLAYSLFIVYTTLFPFAFLYETQRLTDFSIKPFFIVYLSGNFVDYRDIISNLFFFFPLGYFLGKNFETLRSKWIAFLPVFFVSFLLSSWVEYLQLYTLNRDTSYYDIICNTLGALGGYYFAWKIPIPRTFAFIKRKVRNHFSSRWAVPALAALVLVCLEALQPFNFYPGVDPTLQKLKELFVKSWVYPEMYLYSLARYAFVYALGSSVFIAWLTDIQMKGAVKITLFFYACVGLVLELLQLLVLSRTPGLPDMAAVCLGSIFGVLAYLYIPQRKQILAIIFWGFIGVGFAVLFSSSLPENMDYFKVKHLDYFHIQSSQSRWLSIIFSHLSLFFFIGMVIPYIFYRYRVSKGKALINAFVLCASFLLMAKFGIKFSPLSSMYRYVLPLSGLFAGYLLFIWVLLVMKDVRVKKHRFSQGNKFTSPNK